MENKQKQILEKKQNEKRQEAIEHEKTLFDFDEDVNQLEGVEERYPPNFTMP